MYKMLLQAIRTAKAPTSAQVHAGTLAAQMLKIAQAVAAVAAGVVEEAFRDWCCEQARFLLFVSLMPNRHALVSRSGCCTHSCPKACGTPSEALHH
jgi:hypothetical protein